MELEGFFDEARGAGTLDSSGRFTLDLPRAWEKLGRFSAASPLHFVLHLVRAAVGSGAPAVDFREVVGGLQLQFEASLPAEEELFDHPLRRDGTPWLRELALGVFLALRGGLARKVRLEGAQSSLDVSLDGGLPKSLRGPGKAPGVKVLLTASSWRRRFPGVSALVRRHGRLSPVPLRWNGSQLNCGPDLRGVRVWLRVTSSQQLPGVGLPEPAPAEARHTEQPYEAVLGLARGYAPLVLVVNGVAQELEWQPLPGARLWVANPTVPLDLSGAVVHSEQFLWMMEDLSARLMDLAAEHPQSLEPEGLLWLVEHLPRADLANELGLQALRAWPESHPARPALLATLTWLSLSRRDFEGAQTAFAELLAKARGVPGWWARLLRQKPFTYPPRLTRLADVLIDLATDHPQEALNWLYQAGPLAGLLGRPLARQSLLELALRFGRYGLAEQLSLDLLRPRLLAARLIRPERPLRTPAAMSLALAHLPSCPELAPELLGLLRAVAPRSRTRLSQEFARLAPVELRRAALEQFADSLRWASERHNDRQLFESSGFRWRGEFLQQADGLYFEALRLAEDEATARRLRLNRARAACVPIEGLARAAARLKTRRWHAARDRASRLALERLAEAAGDPAARLLEAEVCAELGAYERAGRLLEGVMGVGQLELQAQVDRQILLGLQGRLSQLEEFSEQLRRQFRMVSPARTHMAEVQGLFYLSQALPDLPESLGGRLIRLAELAPVHHMRTLLLRCALCARFRWLSQTEVDWRQLPVAAARLEAH